MPNVSYYIVDRSCFHKTLAVKVESLTFYVIDRQELFVIITSHNYQDYFIIEIL